jgi:hypothetical protein
MPHKHIKERKNEQFTPMLAWNTKRNLQKIKGQSEQWNTSPHRQASKSKRWVACDAHFHDGPVATPNQGQGDKGPKLTPSETWMIEHGSNGKAF